MASTPAASRAETIGPTSSGEMLYPAGVTPPTVQVAAADEVGDRVLGPGAQLAALDELEDDPSDVLGGDAVPDGVHAVAERDVLDEELGHADTSEVGRMAMRSAARNAAEVMMSRLPAYAGR